VAHGACQKLHLPRFQKLSKNKKQWGHETLILKDLFMPTLAIKTTKHFYFIVFIALLAAGCGRGVNSNVPQPVACTQEAKACPDGSYVGRSGPNCEFAACPQPSAKSTSTPPAPVQTGGINGYIHTGPTCPVQRILPDPNCADRPYANIGVMAINSAGKQYQTQADAAGNFSVAVPTGTYTVKVISANMLPRCNDQTAEVTANKFTSVDISCDTGIR